MNFLRHLNKDRLGAILLIVLGSAVTLQSQRYQLGSLTHMGAGFLPTVYGVLLVAIGVVLGLGSERGRRQAGAPAEWRGWLCILGAVLAFVIVGHYGGLVPATFVCVFIGALGDRKNTLRDAALLSLGMTVAGTLIFHYGLQLQLPLLGSGR